MPRPTQAKDDGGRAGRRRPRPPRIPAALTCRSP